MHIELGEDFTIDGRTVTVRAGDHESTYRIPRAARVTLWRMKGGRARLHVGGFKTITVTVVGDAAAVSGLRDALVDTPTRK